MVETQDLASLHKQRYKNIISYLYSNVFEKNIVYVCKM